jgi:5'-nucleotidase
VKRRATSTGERGAEDEDRADIDDGPKRDGGAVEGGAEDDDATADDATRPDIAREAQRVERRDIDRDAGEPVAQRDRRLNPPRATARAARPLSEWETRPRILVTNDDGIESRGLLALKQSLEPLGDVYVLAPETNQSAVGHTKTFMRPLRVRERTLVDGTIGYSVDGSPTDAVSLAFLGYFDIGFDLVASGINYGANLGDDITYSGTVSAAMEAVLSAVPAFAISQEYYEHPDFTLAAQIAHVAAVNILENGLAPGELININVPAISVAQSRGVEVTRMGKRIYQDELIERLDPRGTPYYWIGGPPPSGLAEPGTDFHAVVNKRIAITPIQLDLTARRLLGRLNSWSWTLPTDALPIPAAAEPQTRTAERQDEIVTAQAEPEDERR